MGQDERTNVRPDPGLAEARRGKGGGGSGEGGRGKQPTTLLILTPLISPPLDNRGEDDQWGRGGGERESIAGTVPSMLPSIAPTVSSSMEAPRPHVPGVKKGGPGQSTGDP